MVLNEFVPFIIEALNKVNINICTNLTACKVDMYSLKELRSESWESELKTNPEVMDKVYSIESENYTNRVISYCQIWQ